MQRSNGFTLIELVVVIIILGILSVVAAPKFIDLKGDAHTATVEAMAGAIDSTNSLVYSKSAINGVEDERSIDAEAIGDEYAGATLVYGSMEAEYETLAMFVDGIEDPTAWEVVDNTFLNNSISVYPANHHSIVDGGDCFVEYTNPQTITGENTPPETTVYTADC
ncbi:type II secretion system protein [uncultured Shewanella sp.]|uniref:type II secretion system protein n=1 Tax=uncultured Shewanella sp. TaxID=173975 RepID=UPI002638E587|nr:type II secretion system protein [uncultured Shewanella sp.]